MRPSQAYWHVRDVVEKLRTVQEKARRLLDHGDAENALALLLILVEETSAGIELIDDSADGSCGRGTPTGNRAAEKFAARTSATELAHLKPFMESAMRVGWFGLDSPPW